MIKILYIVLFVISIGFCNANDGNIFNNPETENNVFKQTEIGIPPPGGDGAGTVGTGSPNTVSIDTHLYALMCIGVFIIIFKRNKIQNK